MCIIGVYKKSAFLDEKELENMWNSNNDGVGFSIYNETTGKWETKKGIMTFEELKNILNEKGILNNILDATLVIHFRAATHGGVRKSLTHPFIIKSRDGEILLYHNGVFSIDHIYLWGENIKDYEVCGINYKSLYTSYSYHSKSSIGVEEDVELDAALDPEKLKVHSDTSLVALLVSELSLPSDSIVKLFNSPLMKDVVNFSRICLCVEGNSEPILIGNWVKESELKMFSNYGYRDFYSKYKYKGIYSKDYLYKSDVTTSYKDEDYKSTFNEREKNYEVNYVDSKKLAKKDYYITNLGSTAGIIYPVKKNFEIFLPVYYNGKASEISGANYEVFLTDDGFLYVIINEKLYPIYFLSESLEKYLKKYNLNNKIGIAVDKNFNFYFVQKIKSSGKFNVHPVKKLLKNPIAGYFYNVEKNSIEAIEEYYLIENEE
ncbi:MAG: class II glutamine amidotransferase [Elusimicrobiales bacterium]|nr:class II glutamine amidotransferase [Elusimicrobiales bacterium]